MEPIKISVEVSLNLSEKTQDFLKSIFTGASISAAPAKPAAPAPTKPVEQAKPAPAKPAAPTPAPAPAKPAAPTPAPAPAPAKPVASTSSISIEDVRRALSEKVNEHRAEIKDKLNSFGAPSVTKLDPAKYQEMYDFLKTL